jgi:hypothetical protein
MFDESLRFLAIRLVDSKLIIFHVVGVRYFESLSVPAQNLP